MNSTLTISKHILKNVLIQHKETGDVVLVCEKEAVLVYSAGTDKSYRLGHTWRKEDNNCFFRDYIIDGWSPLPPGHIVSLSN